MKKSKKIPYTPKYKFGGFEKTIFTPDKDDKQKMKKFGKQAGTAAYGVGEGLLDTVTMGATDQITDQGYYALQKAGNSTQDEMREQDSIRGFSNAAGAIGGAIINPGATGTAISQTGKGLGAGVSKGNESKDWAQGAGMALNTAGQIGAMAYGQAGSPMSSGMQTQAGNFNASSFGQGLDKYNKYMNQGSGNGQMGGILNSFMGGGSGGVGAGFMPNLPNNVPYSAMKYGGQMKFGMGGMQYANGGTGEMNAEVEGGGYGQDGENAVAPGGEFTQFNGPTHAQGGIQTDMAPGTRIFSDKLKAPGTNKSFAKLNTSNNTNREDKLETKGNLDPKSKTSIDLTRMAKMKNSDMLFAMQEQLKKDKVAAYAKKMGVEIPPMDNQQISPQGMPGQPQGKMPIVRHGGMFAMGGVQLPYYNTDNAGNPIYAMGGGYPAMTNPYHNFKGSIPMYEDGGNMLLDPPTSNGTTPVKQGIINVPLKKSEVTGYSKTGFDQANVKVKDRKIDLYKNPDYLIEHPEIGGAKWNDFQTFLQSYKLPTGENYIGNEAANTKLANDYTNLAMSDYNKSLSNKYKNNPNEVEGRSINLGDIEQVQTYYNQGDPNVKVDQILGGETSQFRYPHWSSVSKKTAKKGEYMPITYGGKQYVVDADTYNNKINPIWEGKSSENVTKYFQPYDYKKHMTVDQGNVDIVNRLNTQGGSGVFTKKSYQPPPFIFRNGQGSMDEQKRAYNKANGLADDFGFKYGGQMPKYVLGGVPKSNLDYSDEPSFGYVPQTQMEANKMYQMEQNRENPQFATLTSERMQPVQITNPYDTPGLMNAPVYNPSKYGTGHYDPKDQELRGPGASIQELPAGLPQNQNGNKPNWMDIVGKGVNFAAQNAGNIYNLSRYDKPEEEKYERLTGKFLDPTQARRDEQYAYRQANKAIPGLVGGSGAAAMNLLGANRAKTSTNIGRINKEYENANAQIGNQINQYNTGLSQQEVIANAANRARYRSGKGEAISQIGKNYNQMALDTKKGKMDKSMMEMMPKLINNPEFQKFYTEWMKNNAGSSVG